MENIPLPQRWRRWLWLGLRATGWFCLVVGLILVCWLHRAFYHRFVRFPGEEAGWRALQTERQPVPEEAGWHEYRGILHSHSRFSHDSEVPQEEILGVMKAIGLDFICLSDHCIAGRADFNLQWRGLHDAKLFIPGFEMNQGFMPFGAAPGVVLTNGTDSATLARQIAENGGLLFYAHPEEARDWDRPELVGMEIYNIHTDFKRLSGAVAMLPDLLLNQRRYPEQVFRTLFVRPTEFLRHWDELNRTRHITGIAGNDCHQNVGVRAFCTPAGTIRIEDTSPKTLRESKLNGFTRLVARALFGPLQPNRMLFHFQLDPYGRMARYVNTHVLAHELTEPAVKDALRAGRVFIGFDMVADSSSFLWSAVDGNGTRALMGEATLLSAAMRLRARSPVPCRFSILRDGRMVYQATGRTVEWTPPGPGKYRVEAELLIRHEWVPWVYANPIELR